MTTNKELIKENRILKMEVENLRKRQFSTKESLLKEVASLFGEQSHSVEKYKYKDEEKEYLKLEPFYDALGRIGRDNLLELIRKLKSSDKEDSQNK